MKAQKRKTCTVKSHCEQNRNFHRIEKLTQSHLIANTGATSTQLKYLHNQISLRKQQQLLLDEQRRKITWHALVTMPQRSHEVEAFFYIASPTKIAQRKRASSTSPPSTARVVRVSPSPKYNKLVAPGVHL